MTAKRWLGSCQVWVGAKSAAVRSAAIAGAVKSPDVSNKLESLGNVARGSSAAEAQAYVEAESKRWHEIISASGVHHE